MKIVIPGGSGHVGTLLARTFHERGDEVVVLSRQPVPNPWKTVAWDGERLGPWIAEFEGADVVINLAGRSVNCRYEPRNRREILDSRVNSTRAVGQAIGSASRPPRIWLQMSTATIYAHRYDAPHDEATGVIGGHELNLPDTWQFSVNVAKAWEQAALETSSPRTRKVLLRTAIVMSPGATGPFHLLRALVRWGLGGPAGDGRQFVSWIHGTDFVAATNWLIAHEEIEGAVNLAAPSPLPNREFMRALREAARVPVGLPATKAMIEVGAFFLRTESELILKSRRVVPGRLLDGGFDFRFPEWTQAAADLCN
jgi:uncharacterized protein (TIGR01777 family)